MLNQILIACRSSFRHYLKNRTYGSINLLGLATAFATLILVSSYVYQESNYEDFHHQADRIYRPTHLIQGQNDFEMHFARVPVNYINELPDEIPEIEKLIRFQNKEQKYVRIGEKRFKPKHAYVTDQDVFEVFSFPLLSGYAATALKNPNSVVLTEETAIRYFGHSQVVGEEIHVVSDFSSEEQTFSITGVMEEIPINTHLPVEMFFSFANEEERNGWAYIYTLFKEGATPALVQAKVEAFIETRSDPGSPMQISFVFQPLSDIHLNSHLAREIVPNGDQLYLIIFWWVGIFVWLIAVINFSNLGAALAMGRAKEIGVRKVLGAHRRQLIFSTLGESIVQSLAALILGGVLAIMVFPAFSNLTGIVLLIPLYQFAAALVLLGIATGIIAGVLPSLTLSSMKVLGLLRQRGKWQLRSSQSKLNTKRLMVTAQFCITIILIGSALIAYQQFNFVNEKNLGIKSEQILTIAEVPSEVTQNYRTLKNQLLQIPGVLGVTGCMQLPSSEIRDVGPVVVQGRSQSDGEAPMMDIQIIDPDFMQIMELELVAGEDFTRQLPVSPYPELREDFTVVDYLASTPRKYFINETAMQQLGWSDPNLALGQEINWSIGNLSLAPGPIAGVIKDYHQESLKNKVDPLVLTTEPLWWSNLLIKVDAEQIATTIAQTERIWHELFPYALDYSFLDEAFTQLYVQDRVQLSLLSMLTLIAIIISFLGLVGLVAYALRSRAKELAIRRVVGADLKSLASLVGQEYLIIVLVASIVAVPISYRWVSIWLENFAYRIDVSPFYYIAAIGLIITLLVLVIFWQTKRATIINPLVALKED